jgi:hypothetical protein
VESSGPGGVECLEKAEVANRIRELARRMLRAAYSRRRDMFGLEDVIAPRADELVREHGYEYPSDPDMWAAEQWLEDHGYIVAAPFVEGEPSPYGVFYMVTPKGMDFMAED